MSFTFTGPLTSRCTPVGSAAFNLNSAVGPCLSPLITDLKVVATTVFFTRGANGIPSKVSDVFLTS